MQTKPFDEIERTTRYVIVAWELGKSEEGKPCPTINPETHEPYDRLTVQFSGEFDEAIAEIDGSIAADTFTPLRDRQEAPLQVVSSPAIYSLHDLVKAVKPKISGGTDKTKITVTMIMA